jgi:hypothetical protein
LLPFRRLVSLLDPEPSAWTDRDLAIGLSRTHRWAGYTRLCALGTQAACVRCRPVAYRIASAPLRKIQQESKEASEEAYVQAQAKRQQEAPRVGRVLLLYVDEAVEDVTPFGAVRNQAFTILPREALLAAGQRLRKTRQPTGATLASDRPGGSAVQAESATTRDGARILGGAGI